MTKFGRTRVALFVKQVEQVGTNHILETPQESI